MDNDTDVNELIGEAIPNFFNNMELPDPNLVMYYYNLNHRVLWIDRDIDDSLLREVRQVLKWNQEDAGKSIENREPIHVFLQSIGGDVTSCFTFIDTLSLSKTPVYTYNVGVCMSAALLMLLAGQKRYCFKHSQVMIHQGSSKIDGDYTNVEAAMETFKKITVMMKDYILERSLIDAKTYNKYKEKDWYLFAEDQVKYGIVDKIIQNLDEIL